MKTKLDRAAALFARSDLSRSQRAVCAGRVRATTIGELWAVRPKRQQVSADRVDCVEPLLSALLKASASPLEFSGRAMLMPIVRDLDLDFTLSLDQSGSSRIY